MLRVFRRYRFSRVNELIEGRDYFQAHRLLAAELEAKRGPQNTYEELISHINILKKIALCEIQLRNYHNADSYLSSAVHRVRDAKFLDKATQTALRKSVYHTYVLYLTLNDPLKAEEFAQATYEIEHNSKIAGMLRFYDGATSLLNEKFLDSKNTLSSIIDDGMDFTLSAMAYNNLGVACWWARHPNYSPLEDEYDRMVELQEIDPNFNADEDQSDDLDGFTASAYKIKVADFSHADSMFWSSIQQFEFSLGLSKSPSQPENDPGISGERPPLAIDGALGEELPMLSYQIAKKLSAENFADDSALVQYLTEFRKGGLFLNPLSATPLFNLAELKLSTASEPIERKKGVVYLHLAFKLLLQNFNRIRAFKKGEMPEGWTRDDFLRLYLDYERNYRSLLIRSITLYSKIKDLDIVS